MSRLRITSRPPAEDGRQLRITPESAGWRYVGFEVYTLPPDQTIGRDLGGTEACIVLLSGIANIKTNTRAWRGIGERESVFDPIPPYSVYVPSADTFEIRALTTLQVAIGFAPGKATHPARLIPPDAVGLEDRGRGNNARKIRNILPETEPADSLLVVEVVTPGGHWSSYPPHKHDRDQLPDESFLEEIYYHRINPRQGFAVQRVYTDDGSMDETLTVNDGDSVLVPRGYHPVGAPPGYDVYYLNVMAGPRRSWRFHNDPRHAWLLNSW